MDLLDGSHDVEQLLSTHDRILQTLRSLPILTQDLVPPDDSCPICLVPFASILAEQHDQNSPALDAGVTKLAGCGHIFCRQDLNEWIRSHHGSCPTCRHTFLDIPVPSESDGESSDGGEYIPNEDDDDDGFSETEDIADFGLDEMESDIDDMWGPDEEMMDGSEWGLTDGESEALSDEGMTLMEDEAFDIDVGVADGDVAYNAIENGCEPK